MTESLTDENTCLNKLRVEKSNWIEIIVITIKLSSNYLPLKKVTVTFTYGPERTGIMSEFCQMRHSGEEKFQNQSFSL